MNSMTYPSSNTFSIINNISISVNRSNFTLVSNIPLGNISTFCPPPPLIVYYRQPLKPFLPLPITFNTSQL